MPQEPRCAFRPIVTQRAALTVHISQSYHGGIIDNTSSHLVKQLTKHSSQSQVRLFLLTCPSLFRIPHPSTVHEPMRTDNPSGGSSHPAIQPSPCLSDDLSSVCVCVCVSVCLTVPHRTRMRTCSCSCTAARRFDARRK